MSRTHWLVATVAAGWMGAASAQGVGGAPESQARANAAQQETATSRDAAIRLPKLHVGNAAEIEAGTWMQQHATSSKVKGFAKKMVKDHGAMDKDLRAYAHEHGVKLMGTTSVEEEKVHHAEALDVLKKMHGPQADRTYMQMMVQEHTRDVSELKRGAELARQGSDEDYSKLLDKAAKTMESHLEDAQRISREMVPRQARSPNS
jgi:putative membrane protein